MPSQCNVPSPTGRGKGSCASSWLARPGKIQRLTGTLPHRALRGLDSSLQRVPALRTNRNWPHPGERDNKPDDAILFDLLLDWAPEERVRNRILVQNPEALYGFAKSA